MENQRADNEDILEAKHVFVYGTLMWEEVAHGVITGRYRKAPAVLHGYSRKWVRYEWYPGIVPDSDASVNGWIWFDVSADDLRRLDEFEGDEYVRTQVTVQLDTGEELPVDVYRIRDERLEILETADWDEEQFEQHGLPEFIVSYPPSA